MPVIKNMNDLQKIVEQKIRQALDLTQQEINRVLDYYIESYYDEYDPLVYNRTDMLRNSPIKPQIVKNKNGYSCVVGIDEEYLNYSYPDTWRYAGSPNVKDTPATGLDIMQWSEKGLHGGTVQGSVRIWHDTLEELGGREGIIELMKTNMRKVGLPIK